MMAPLAGSIAAPAGHDGADAQASGARGRRGASTRWFAALDPRGAPPVAPRRTSTALLAPLALGLAAVGAAVLVQQIVPRVLVPVALVAAALALLWRWSMESRHRHAAGAAHASAPGRARRAAVEAGVASAWSLRGILGSGSGLRIAGAATPAVGRGITLDGKRLAFRSGRGRAAGAEGFHEGAAGSRPRPSVEAEAIDTLLVLDAPFGVTLLASPRRDRVIALLSSASGTFYLGAAFDAAARRAFAPLLDRSFTVTGDDPGMEAIGPDGEPLVLAPDELASLLDALVEQSPTCLDRFVSTDARGVLLMLDGKSLAVGDRAVDLNAPLEWKPIVFQEALGETIAVYQGTWIRQSTTELTLVSLLPGLGSSPAAELDLGSLDRAVLRDLRLMQATPEVPPPTEQRVAIDRLFMLPVRSVLDRAPRASRQTNRAQA